MDFTDLLKYFQDQPKQEQSVSDEDLAKKERFLNLRRDIESLGTQDRLNVVHPKGHDVLHKNERAFGAYGLMPNTVRLELRNNKKYDQGLKPNMSSLKDAPEDIIRGVLKDNEPLQRDIAGDYYDRILRNKPKAEDNEELQHYLYQMGASTSDKKLTQKNLDKNASVQRFRQLKAILDGDTGTQLVKKNPLP